MIWRLKTASLDGHEGYAYFRSKRAALKYVKDELGGYVTEKEYLAATGPIQNRGAHWALESAHTPKNKQEMVNLLIDWGSHNNNG